MKRECRVIIVVLSGIIHVPQHQDKDFIDTLPTIKADRFKIQQLL
jgi:hypothetical protein